MSNYKKIKEKISKLNKIEKEILILDLLIGKEIDYISISNMYVKCLETRDKKNWIKERLIAGCLASKYQNINEEYVNARSSILIEPHVPDEFITKYVLKNVSKEAIEKEKELLKRELKE